MFQPHCSFGCPSGIPSFFFCIRAFTYFFSLKCFSLITSLGWLLLAIPFQPLSPSHLRYPLTPPSPSVPLSYLDFLQSPNFSFSPSSPSGIQIMCLIELFSVFHIVFTFFYRFFFSEITLCISFLVWFLSLPSIIHSIFLPCHFEKFNGSPVNPWGLLWRINEAINKQQKSSYIVNWDSMLPGIWCRPSS